MPLTNIPSLPYLFRSPEHARNVMMGPIGDEIAAGFEQYGVVVLAYYDGGARSFYNSKKPINSLTDLAGHPLPYRDALRNSHGLIASNGRAHAAVVERLAELFPGGHAEP